MVVGFVIRDFNGYIDYWRTKLDRPNSEEPDLTEEEATMLSKKAAISFIKEVCVLEDTSVAENIVNAGTGINIWTSSTTEAELDSLPFTCEPIIIESGEYLIISIVDFPVSFPYRESQITLKPTEYVRATYFEAEDIYTWIKQGLLTVKPKARVSDLLWILSGGTWSDSRVWLDSESWED